MATPKITKMVAGKTVEVPLEEVWPSICKVIRLARVLCSPDSKQGYEVTRMAFLTERLTDLNGMELHDERPTAP